MDAKTTALALVDFVAADSAFKADVIDEIIDALIGTDPTAVVQGIKGIPPEMVELISDGISDALKNAIKAKLGAA